MGNTHILDNNLTPKQMIINYSVFYQFPQNILLYDMNHRNDYSLYITIEHINIVLGDRNKLRIFDNPR